MKKYLLFVLILFFFSCAAQPWVFVEESVLMKAEYQKGSFSVSPYWTLTFESGTVLVIGAKRDKALFVGKVYEIYYREGTDSYSEKYEAVLKSLQTKEK